MVRLAEASGWLWNTSRTVGRHTSTFLFWVFSLLLCGGAYILLFRIIMSLASHKAVNGYDYNGTVLRCVP